MSARHPTARQRLRHALLGEWRGVEGGPVLDLPVRSAADLVAKILQEAGMGERVRLEEVQGAWREVVGDFIYQNSRPDAIQRGALIVRVLQPAVLHALTMERGRILARLREKLPGAGIKEVRLKHG